jgi:alpha-ketoglutarate-dependent taurine dioxygenase
MNDGASWKPFEITPESIASGPGIDSLCDYLAEPENIDKLLVEKKALAFCGFGISAEQLGRVTDLLLHGRLPYIHGNSPRTMVGDKIYTSTEYPPEFTISMHNELSYAATWPARLLFFCETAASTGGATPITDGAAWLQSLDDEVRDAFSGGIRYVQNLHGGRGLGRSWQETFETSDKKPVEEYLSAAGATWEWSSRGLRVTQVRPASTRHPVTGSEVWFNQADQWHIATTVDSKTAVALADVLPEEQMPQSVRFADGTPIPDEYVLQIQRRGLESAVDQNWHPGDLLLIDNVLVAHGRRPYSGKRRVLVAMSS